MSGRQVAVAEWQAGGSGWVAEWWQTGGSGRVGGSGGSGRGGRVVAVAEW
jgi:hypothetical protein